MKKRFLMITRSLFRAHRIGDATLLGDNDGMAKISSPVSPHPQPLRSVSRSSLSFSSPPLFLPSTAFPSGCRIVFRITLKIPHRFRISLFGQGRNQERITASLGNTKSSRVLTSKVGEWCVSRYVIFPKCEFSTLRKFAIVRFQRM